MTAKTTMLAAKAKDTQACVPSTGYKKSSIDVAIAPGSTDADFAVAVARTLTWPETSAASVIENWQKDTHDINALSAELRKQIEAVNGGDLRRAEGLLIAQAHTLDAIFANLARRATGQQYLAQWETYMRMAMKAQNQCRMTLDTLGTIKNPPVVFARQANINNGGQQQVNNGAPQSAPSHSETSAASGSATELAMSGAGPPPLTVPTAGEAVNVRSATDEAQQPTHSEVRDARLRLWLAVAHSVTGSPRRQGEASTEGSSGQAPGPP